VLPVVGGCNGQAFEQGDGATTFAGWEIVRTTRDLHLGLTPTISP
jgi:hypothetical protein